MSDKTNTQAERREFVRRTGQLMVGGLLGGGMITQASAAQRGFSMSSSTEGQCISCKYWGGVRRISEDGKTITAESLGWCNNPNSMQYQKMTPPDFGPMKKWVKWGALG